MNQTDVFVGIDVANTRLAVALHQSGETWTVPNDEAGIATLVAPLQQRRVARIVLEATGGLELPRLSALGAAALPAVAVNSRQVRAFAKALGRLAKTDRLDAHVLALFAARVRPALRPLPDQATQALSAWGPVGANWSRGSRPKRIGRGRRPPPSKPTVRRTSPGWRPGWSGWIRTWAAPQTEPPVARPG